MVFEKYPALVLDACCTSHSSNHIQAPNAFIEKLLEPMSCQVSTKLFSGLQTWCVHIEGLHCRLVTTGFVSTVSRPLFFACSCSSRLCRCEIACPDRRSFSCMSLRFAQMVARSPAGPARSDTELSMHELKGFAFGEELSHCS